MLEKDGFECEPVRFSKGDHLVVRVSKGGRSGQITIAGSPSGNALYPIRQAARRVTRE